MTQRVKMKLNWTNPRLTLQAMMRGTRKPTKTLGCSQVAFTLSSLSCSGDFPIATIPG